jgi:hypothetical protein
VDKTIENDTIRDTRIVGTERMIINVCGKKSEELLTDRIDDA